jgi:hypothetical protein
MKAFKYADALISLVLISFFGSLALTRGLDILITGYLIVGGWQVISMLVHIVKKWFVAKTGVRYYYHWLSFLLLVTFFIGSLWLLFYLAPFMAIFYTGLCIYEIKKIRPRPLALLK